MHVQRHVRSPARADIAHVAQQAKPTSSPRGNGGAGEEGGLVVQLMGDGVVVMLQGPARAPHGPPPRPILC
eukprot:3940537-Rhodomonas_salina.1